MATRAAAPRVARPPGRPASLCGPPQKGAPAWAGAAPPAPVPPAAAATPPPLAALSFFRKYAILPGNGHKGRCTKGGKTTGAACLLVWASAEGSTSMGRCCPSCSCAACCCCHPTSAGCTLFFQKVRHPARKWPQGPLHQGWQDHRGGLPPCVGLRRREHQHGQVLPLLLLCRLLLLPPHLHWLHSLFSESTPSCQEMATRAAAPRVARPLGRPASLCGPPQKGAPAWAGAAPPAPVPPAAAATPPPLAALSFFRKYAILPGNGHKGRCTKGGKTTGAACLLVWASAEGSTSMGRCCPSCSCAACCCCHPTSTGCTLFFQKVRHPARKWPQGPLHQGWQDRQGGLPPCVGLRRREHQHGQVLPLLLLCHLLLLPPHLHWLHSLFSESTPSCQEMATRAAAPRVARPLGRPASLCGPPQKGAPAWAGAAPPAPVPPAAAATPPPLAALSFFRKYAILPGNGHKGRCTKGGKTTGAACLLVWASAEGSTSMGRCCPTGAACLLVWASAEGSTSMGRCCPSCSCAACCCCHPTSAGCTLFFQKVRHPARKWPQGPLHQGWQDHWGGLPPCVGLRRREHQHGQVLPLLLLCRLLLLPPHLHWLHSLFSESTPSCQEMATRAAAPRVARPLGRPASLCGPPQKGAPAWAGAAPPAPVPPAAAATPPPLAALSFFRKYAILPGNGHKGRCTKGGKTTGAACLLVWASAEGSTSMGRCCPSCSCAACCCCHPTSTGCTLFFQKVRHPARKWPQGPLHQGWQDHRGGLPPCVGLRRREHQHGQVLPLLLLCRLLLLPPHLRWLHSLFSESTPSCQEMATRAAAPRVARPLGRPASLCGPPQKGAPAWAGAAPPAPVPPAAAATPPPLAALSFFRKYAILPGNGHKGRCTKGGKTTGAACLLVWASAEGSTSMGRCCPSCSCATCCCCHPTSTGCTLFFQKVRHPARKWPQGPLHQGWQDHWGGLPPCVGLRRREHQHGQVLPLLLLCRLLLLPPHLHWLHSLFSESTPSCQEMATRAAAPRVARPPGRPASLCGPPQKGAPAWAGAAPPAPVPPAAAATPPPLAALSFFRKYAILPGNGHKGRCTKGGKTARAACGLVFASAEGSTSMGRC
ncbi:uncharacterized protein LOC132592820 isoform X1 [Zootoca vivipara]|uniref:uncharacterized protein LOC132592820 isoform X1 n=1 Tax=Zootoca vivipara TaxID=8524 RepID=UPI00293C02CE|nr:uncharacterized protein LOC132592820 isoform X1 [Zootoca vivipara]